MFKLIINMLQIVVLLVKGYLLQYFLGSFLKKRPRCGFGSGGGIAAAYCTLAYGLDFLLPQEQGSLRTMGKQFFTLLITWGILYFFYGVKNRLGIYLVVTFQAICECCFLIAYMILQLGQPLNALWLELLDEGYFASTDSFFNTVEVTMMLLMILMYAVFIGLAYLFLRRIVESFGDGEYDIEKGELLFILTPGLTGLLLCVLLRLIMISVEVEGPRLLYDKYPLLIILVPAILFLALLSMVLGVKLFQDMLALHQERSSRMVLERQIENMQAHIKDVEHIYGGMRSVRHDIKNTISIIMQLMREEDKNVEGELDAYVGELNRNLSELEFHFQTGNHVVDVLLNMKHREIIRDLPNLKFDAEGLLLPRDLRISSYDIGVILGNALDNAMDASRKLRGDAAEDAFIRLSCFLKGKLLFIEVENRFDGRLIQGGGLEFPESDKEDKKSHGIGLSNMKRTAQKYHGAVDWSVNQTVFTLAVMLKNERREEDEFRTDRAGK